MELKGFEEAEMAGRTKCVPPFGFEKAVKFHFGVSIVPS